MKRPRQASCTISATLSIETDSGLSRCTDSTRISAYESGRATRSSRFARLLHLTRLVVDAPRLIPAGSGQQVYGPIGSPAASVRPSVRHAAAMDRMQEVPRRPLT
jgi:hypothetical protein